MEEKKAVIFDIGRFRNADGPGIRTIIFFKGCPLHCKWCSNPFGLTKKRQLVVNPSRCSGCGLCEKVCQHGVNTLITPGEPIKVDFDKCKLCGLCVPICICGARMISGKEYTAFELAKEAGKDAAFYRRGNGGVTLSGGEVLYQHDVAAEVLRLCKNNYHLNTCIETSGFAKWENFQQVAQYCDTVFMDFKHIDSEKHREFTGVPNEIILENMAKVAAEMPAHGGRLIIRMPIIPGYNDSDEEIAAAGTFFATLEGNPEINLLPYHNLGETKYEMIGQKYGMEDGIENRKAQDPRMLAIRDIIAGYVPGSRVSIGGDAIDLSRA